MTPFDHYVTALVGFVILLLTGIILLYKHWFSYWKKRGIECLEPMVPFGNALNLYLRKVCFGELFGDWYLQLKQKGLKHGGVYFFGKPFYIPVDQEIIKHILIRDFQNFKNHGFYVDEEKDPMSVHLFNMEGERWRTLRSKLPSAFTTAKMRRMFVIMERISRELVPVLDSYAQEQRSVDIKNVLSRFTTDIITACAFGMESNTLKNKNNTLMQQGRVFFDYQWSITRNTIVFLVPRQILNFLRFKIFRKDTTKYFFEMFRSIKDSRKEETFKRGDIAELLIRLCDENDELLKHDFEGKGRMEPLSFEEFAAQMYVFFEAGFETSSSTQAFGLYELAVHQEHQKKLREEINTVLERHGGKVTFDAVAEMEFLDRVVDETLRKYPIFPTIARASVNDYKIPGTDVTIEKNTPVIISNVGLQYDPEYYPEPQKFDPDRFTKENKAKIPTYAYLPFGEGPRICIGKRFGLLQTKIGLITAVRNYEITLSKKCKLPFKFGTSGIILHMKGGVWLDLKKIT